MIWSKLSFSPHKPENEEEKKLLPTKASQPASPNSYSVLGSTLETIHSKVVASSIVLPNPFCGRIGEDKKVVKFVTQESKFTHLHLHFPWVGKLFIILHLNPQSTCKKQSGPLGGTHSKPNDISLLLLLLYTKKTSSPPQPQKTLVHSVFKPSVGVGPHIIIIIIIQHHFLKDLFLESSSVGLLLVARSNTLK